MNFGAVAVADLMPVTAVTAFPALGSAPAENASVSVSSATVAENEGRDPAEPKGFIEAVLGVTVTVGAATVPEGVKLPEALSLNARAFRLPVEPNSRHLLSTPDHINSLFPYPTMLPDFGVTDLSPMVIGDVVAPSVIAVVVTPRYEVELVSSDIRFLAVSSLIS